MPQSTPARTRPSSTSLGSGGAARSSTTRRDAGRASTRATARSGGGRRASGRQACTPPCDQACTLPRSQGTLPRSSRGNRLRPRGRRRRTPRRHHRSSSSRLLLRRCHRCQRLRTPQRPRCPQRPRWPRWPRLRDAVSIARVRLRAARRVTATPSSRAAARAVSPRVVVPTAGIAWPRACQ